MKQLYPDKNDRKPEAFLMMFHGVTTTLKTDTIRVARNMLRYRGNKPEKSFEKGSEFGVSRMLGANGTTTCLHVSAAIWLATVARMKLAPQKNLAALLSKAAMMSGMYQVNTPCLMLD